MYFWLILIFFGGQYILGGLRGTRGGVKPPSPLTNRALGEGPRRGNKGTPNRSFGCNRRTAWNWPTALVTLPRYGWATKWHNYCIYIVTQKSKMAAANASFLNFNKQITQIVCTLSTALPIFYMSKNSMELFYVLWAASGSQKLQDGGSQRGNNNISACTHVQHSCKIPMATFMFLRFKKEFKKEFIIIICV